jgi:uncharacterized protein YndB with AHSA1/START domain
MSDEELPATSDAGRWIEVRRRFTAPWQVVFRQWVEPNELAAWFGPVGFEVTDFTVDPVEGGSWRLGLRSPAGDPFVVFGEYVAIDPPRRLRFTWRVEGAVGAPEATEVEVTLRPEEGTTRLSLRQGPFDSTRAREVHRRAWRSTLESLALKLIEDEAS